MFTIIFATFDIELYVVIYIVRYGGADGGVHITPNPPKTAENPAQHKTTRVFSWKSSVRAEILDPEAHIFVVQSPRRDLNDVLGGGSGGPQTTAESLVQHTTTCVFSREVSVIAEIFDPEADSGCVRMPSRVVICSRDARVCGHTTQNIDIQVASVGGANLECNTFWPTPISPNP